MLKHGPTDRSHTCRPPDAFADWTHQTVQEGTESNGYRGTGPGELFGSVNERSSHHRVVSVQLHDAQISTPRPRASVKKLRKSFISPLCIDACSVNRLPERFIRDSFARALKSASHAFPIDII